MKVVEVTTTDKKTRYYLADDTSAPVEPVLMYLKFKDNAGYARNTLRMHCIHLKHYFTFLRETDRDYEKANVDTLARFIGWLKNPDIGKRIIPLRLEPAHKAQTINANVDTVIAFYKYLLMHEGMENHLSEKLVKFVNSPPKNYRGFLHGIVPDKMVQSHMLKLPVPRQVIRTVSREDVVILLEATTNIRDYFLLYLLFETGMRIGEALQSEEARRAEEIAERKRNSSKKSTQKRNQKRAEIKAKAEAGDPEAMAEYKAILEKGRQNNRKRAEKMRELRMADPEYRAKMEEKERLALEREKKRQERATKKKKIALAELKEQAEEGNQEAVRELEERRAIARERSRKSAEKRKLRAENDPEYAKYLEEKNAEYNRRHTARRKEQLDALKARAEAGDQEAQSQLAEHKQYQVRATVKSYRKMRDDALNGDPIAKERYEKTLAKRREAYHAKKNEQSA